VDNFGNEILRMMDIYHQKYNKDIKKLFLAEEQQICPD
jgi:hypothetical protein